MGVTSMIKFDDVKEIVFAAIDEINQQLLKNQQLPKLIETFLTGNDAKLDSMSLVNLILVVENDISNKYNISISLLDERALSQEINPFENVNTFINYILMLIDEFNLKQ
jgi:acyl carrier protein